MTKKNENGMNAWDVLSLVGGMLPGVPAIANGVARNTVQRLVGYWAMWHMFGGLEGLISSGVMTTSTAYRQRAEFETVFGVTVEEWAKDLADTLKAAAEGRLER